MPNRCQSNSCGQIFTTALVAFKVFLILHGITIKTDVVFIKVLNICLIYFKFAFRIQMHAHHSSLFVNKRHFSLLYVQGIIVGTELIDVKPEDLDNFILVRSPDVSMAQ